MWYNGLPKNARHIVDCVYVAPRFAQDELGLDPEQLWQDLCAVPEHPPEQPVRFKPMEPCRIVGGTKELRMRGNPIPRSKVFAQTDASVEYIRYRYPGWCHKIARAAKDVKSLPWLQSFAEKMNAGLPKETAHNYWICTVYQDGNQRISLHMDSPGNIKEESWIVVVKLGATRSFQINGADKKDNIFLEKLEAGTAIFMNTAGNRMVTHGVPRDRDVGVSGSIVGRCIVTRKSWDSIAHHIQTHGGEEDGYDEVAAASDSDSDKGHCGDGGDAAPAVGQERLELAGRVWPRLQELNIEGHPQAATTCKKLCQHDSDAVRIAALAALPDLTDIAKLVGEMLVANVGPHGDVGRCEDVEPPLKKLCTDKSAVTARSTRLPAEIVRDKELYVRLTRDFVQRVTESATDDEKCLELAYTFVQSLCVNNVENALKSAGASPDDIKYWKAVSFKKISEQHSESAVSVVPEHGEDGKGCEEPLGGEHTMDCDEPLDGEYDKGQQLPVPSEILPGSTEGQPQRVHSDIGQEGTKDQQPPVHSEILEMDTEGQQLPVHRNDLPIAPFHLGAKLGDDGGTLDNKGQLPAARGVVGQVETEGQLSALHSDKSQEKSEDQQQAVGSDMGQGNTEGGELPGDSYKGQEDTKEQLPALHSNEGVVYSEGGELLHKGEQLPQAPSVEGPHVEMVVGPAAILSAEECVGGNDVHNTHAGDEQATGSANVHRAAQDAEDRADALAAAPPVEARRHPLPSDQGEKRRAKGDIDVWVERLNRNCTIQNDAEVEQFTKLQLTIKPRAVRLPPDRADVYRSASGAITKALQQYRKLKATTVVEEAAASTDRDDVQVAGSHSETVRFLNSAIEAAQNTGHLLATQRAVHQATFVAIRREVQAFPEAE